MLLLQAWWRARLTWHWLTAGKPRPNNQATGWPYQALRPLPMRAGELAPMPKTTLAIARSFAARLAGWMARQGRRPWHLGDTPGRINRATYLGGTTPP